MPLQPLLRVCCYHFLILFDLDIALALPMDAPRTVTALAPDLLHLTTGTSCVIDLPSPTLRVIHQTVVHVGPLRLLVGRTTGRAPARGGART